MYIGPKVLKQSLIIALDAGSKVSYPGNGTTWTDLTGNGNNSTLTNSPTFNTSNGGFFSFTSPQYGTLPNTTLGNGNLAWTVSVWMKTTTTANDLGLGSILSNQSGGPVYSMMGVNGGKIVYWTYHTDAWQKKLGVGTTVNDGNWHMLTWVNYTNSTMDMYVNGVLDSNVPNSTSGNNNPIDRLAGSWAGFFEGSIAQILLYKDISLTSAQVLQNFETSRNRFGK